MVGDLAVFGDWLVGKLVVGSLFGELVVLWMVGDCIFSDWLMVGSRSWLFARRVVVGCNGSRGNWLVVELAVGRLVVR